MIVATVSCTDMLDYSFRIIETVMCYQVVVSDHYAHPVCRFHIPHVNLLKPFISALSLI